MSKHPIQPVEYAKNGVIRFKPNAIVKYILDNGPFNMNVVELKSFSNEDKEQLTQLLGYSVSGFGDLSYASHETVEKADQMSRELDDYKKPKKKKFVITVMKTEKIEVEVEAENEHLARVAATQRPLPEFPEEIVGVRELKD